MFKRAERKKSKLRLSLCGTSGSGKTFSAIKLAKGLGGKMALIDTENGSAELYSHLAEFDVLNLRPPYSPARYVEAIKSAESLGYQVLIIDSLSHAWVGEGGALDMADKAAKSSNSKNSYYAWRDVTPEHRKLVDAIIGSNLHIIATMRSETAYDTVQNSSGKMVPVKIGLAPIQRKGMEYEFTAVLDLSTDNHIATSSKDRTGLFDSQYITIDEKTGHKLNEWLNSGADIPEDLLPNIELDRLESLSNLNKEINNYKGEIDLCENQNQLKDLYKQLKFQNPELISVLVSEFSKRKEILNNMGLKND